ncbi:MAG: hypothetical protein A2015_04580 [Spirochaetes bacterium GWF1_31_7]|nr:MAG: hypothetical protein A2Y30_16690 [Spirochaetes bacterium GWE1_32_154]OHD52995.1 MAG: hypothetical protein A2015_04580 [Spirochaetes bacterium GWF1_31_7]HBD95848.1 hypothetical protein [Spirochaetia bacterium]HBI37245.1 hypothetical protein [Spirochaetia bacterium]
MGISNVIFIFGSLGIFIYGMMLLSDSLEKAAGDRLKGVLSTMTSNRFLGLLTGFVVTSIIQSSSATTVMVVSFVNAGLLTLVQAIGVIMGANIGTTVTAWIINLTNLKTDMNIVALFAIILGVILLFMKKRKLVFWGHALLGFGFIFIGLNMLKTAVPKPSGLDGTNFLFDFFTWLPKESYWSLFIFVLIGTIFTIVVQSSSVMMAFTITLASQGYIDFYHAAAIVLGENIGTTVTAILASLAGNKMAKKAALAHCMFNIIGVTWMIIPPVFNFTTSLCSQWGGNIPGVSLAVFHTLFNVTNSFILIWFIPQFEKILMYSKKKEVIKYSLLNMDKGFISTPELALLEATKEINNKLLKISEKIFVHTDNIVSFDKDIIKQSGKIKELKEEQKEQSNTIVKFLNKMMESNISADTAGDINKLLFKIRIIENISNSCDKISSKVIKADLTTFSPFIKNKDDLQKLLYKINLLFRYVGEPEAYSSKETFSMGVLAEEDIDKQYWRLKKNTINILKKKSGKDSISTGLIFLEIIKEFEKMGDGLQQILTINFDDEAISTK